MRFSCTEPLVSIITLCHNQADIVERAIRSVLEQTYNNIQLVIVDDCSKDRSREIIQHWKERYPELIKVHFNSENLGHPKSMNVGYNLCDGELVTFCDGDDWYFPEKVEREVAFLANHPDVDVVHSNFDIYSVAGDFIRHWATDAKDIPQGDIFIPLLSLKYPDKLHLRYEMTFKKNLEELNYYDDRIPIWVDWDMRLRLAAKFKFGYVNYIGSAYTINPKGLTNVLKGETIVRYYQFVLEKNMQYLDKYSKDQKRVALYEIERMNIKMKLSQKIQKGQSSIYQTLGFIVKYPTEMRDWRFALAGMFGNNFLKKMSRVKKTIKGW